MARDPIRSVVRANQAQFGPSAVLFIGFFLMFLDTLAGVSDPARDRTLWAALPRAYRTPVGALGMLAIVGYHLAFNRERFLHGREVAGVDIADLLQAWRYYGVAIAILLSAIFLM